MAAIVFCCMRSKPQIKAMFFSFNITHLHLSYTRIFMSSPAHLCYQSVPLLAAFPIDLSWFNWQCTSPTQPKSLTSDAFYYDTNTMTSLGRPVIFKDWWNVFFGGIFKEKLHDNHSNYIWKSDFQRQIITLNTSIKWSCFPFSLFILWNGIKIIRPVRWLNG